MRISGRGCRARTGPFDHGVRAGHGSAPEPDTPEFAEIRAGNVAATTLRISGHEARLSAAETDGHEITGLYREPMRYEPAAGVEQAFIRSRLGHPG